MQPGFCLDFILGLVGLGSGLWLQTEQPVGFAIGASETLGKSSSPTLVPVCQSGVLSLFSGFQCLFCSKIRERMVSCSKA